MWRRRHPVAVLGAVFGVVLVYFVLGYVNGPPTRWRFEAAGTRDDDRT